MLNTVHYKFQKTNIELFINSLLYTGDF